MSASTAVLDAAIITPDLAPWMFYSFGAAVLFISPYLLMYAYSSVEKSAPLPGTLKASGEVELTIADVGGDGDGCECGIPDETARDFTRTFMSKGANISFMTTVEADGNR
jgi:hypothetical protein